MIDFDEDGFMRVKPVGPWQVTEDDKDGTYEMFDIGMAKKYMGIPCCNVWVYCDTKLKVKRIYHGELKEDGTRNFPVFIPVKKNKG